MSTLVIVAVCLRRIQLDVLDRWHIMDEPDKPEQLPPLEDTAVWGQLLDPTFKGDSVVAREAFDLILLIGREMLKCEGCGQAGANVHNEGLQGVQEPGGLRPLVSCVETCSNCGRSATRYHVSREVWAAMEFARVYDAFGLALDVLKLDIGETP